VIAGSGPAIEAAIDCGAASHATVMMAARAPPTFTGMKHCMNQPHVVPAANGKYSECVDDVVASSSATLLAMNDRIAPPQRRSFTPPAGRIYPSGRLLVQLDTAALVLFEGGMSA
jgi:hypothetical protein